MTTKPPDLDPAEFPALVLVTVGDRDIVNLALGWLARRYPHVPTHERVSTHPTIRALAAHELATLRARDRREAAAEALGELVQDIAPYVLDRNTAFGSGQREVYEFVISRAAAIRKEGE